MNNGSGYALQKLELAILLLETGEGDVRSRLSVAYSQELHVVHDQDFPQHLQPEWSWIKTQLTHKGPRTRGDGKVYISAVDNTLHGMHNATGSKIAGRLVALRDTLKGYLNDLRHSCNEK